MHRPLVTNKASFHNPYLCDLLSFEKKMYAGLSLKIMLWLSEFLEYIFTDSIRFNFNPYRIIN